MQAADLDAFGSKRVTQHPAACERKVHVQLVDPPHDGEIGSRDRPWQIIDATAADPQLPRLPRNRQRVDTVDHRFALGNSPAQSRIGAERPEQKIIHQRQLADLGVQRLYVDHRSRRSSRTSDPKTPAAWAGLVRYRVSASKPKAEKVVKLPRMPVRRNSFAPSLPPLRVN